MHHFMPVAALIAALTIISAQAEPNIPLKNSKSNAEGCLKSIRSLPFTLPPGEAVRLDIDRHGCTAAEAATWVLEVEVMGQGASTYDQFRPLKSSDPLQVKLWNRLEELDYLSAGGCNQGGKIILDPYPKQVKLTLEIRNTGDQAQTLQLSNPQYPSQGKISKMYCTRRSGVALR